MVEARRILTETSTRVRRYFESEMNCHLGIKDNFMVTILNTRDIDRTTPSFSRGMMCSQYYCHHHLLCLDGFSRTISFWLSEGVKSYSKGTLCSFGNCQCSI